jgi:membrane protein DedA with SNARE-associated domain
MKKRKIKINPKKLFIFLILLIIIIIWSLILFYFKPEGIVNKIGVKNSYLILGLMALLGGTSIFLPFPYYLFTISFGAAGLNPFLLGLSAGIGTLIGDSTSYYIAYKGRDITPPKFSKFF